MKGISPENQERIQRLLSGTFWSRLFLSAQEQIELVQEIGFSNEPAVIPQIVCLLIDTHGQTWHAATEAVHRLMESLSPLELVRLDSQIRNVGSYDRDADARWRKLQPSRVSRFAKTDFAASLCGLASFHGNGFVREAAVRELLRIKDGNELPFLLIRITDWVPAIRESASKAVQERLAPEYAAHFLKNLRLVLRLENRGRSDKGLVESICSLLRRPECHAVLSAGIASEDRELRRASFQLAAKADEPGRSVIIRAAVTDRDPVARAWAVKRFLPDLSDAEFKEVAIDLLQDPFMAVRREALWTLASRLPDSAGEILRRALLDKSAGVRETARYFLGKSDFNFSSFYAAAIVEAKPEVLPIAIRGLGETGKKADTEQIRPFLSATEPRLQKAAVYALGKIDAESFLSEFMAALKDEHPGVSREAVRASLPKARLLDRDALWALFQTDSRTFVKKHVLMLLQQFGKWERLALLLRACCDADPVIAERAKVGVLNWISKYNYSFAEPSITQIQQSKQALGACVNVLDKNIIAEIGSCISIYENK